MMFKQAVTTEDIFLGMTNKTPLTSACEDLFVSLKLTQATPFIPNNKLKVVNVIISLSFPSLFPLLLLFLFLYYIQLRIHLPNVQYKDVDLGQRQRQRQKVNI